MCYTNIPTTTTTILLSIYKKPKDIIEAMKPPLLGEDASLQRMTRTKKLRVDNNKGDTEFATMGGGGGEFDDYEDRTRDGSGAVRVDANIRPPPSIPSFMESSFSLTGVTSSFANGGGLLHHSRFTSKSLDGFNVAASSPWPKCLQPRLKEFDGTTNSSSWHSSTSSSDAEPPDVIYEW
jgi:hypothetical protein